MPEVVPEDDVRCWTTAEVSTACGVAVAVERRKCIEDVCPRR